MLNFYDKRDNINPIMSNDIFFNAHTKIQDLDIVKDILKIVDKAERLSDLTFIGRSNKFGPLDKQCLSTGTKTLLNIIQYKEKCFNISECGINVLELLPLLDGNVYCNHYINFPITKENKNSQIKYRGKLFSNLIDFNEYYEEVYNEEYPDEL